MIAIIDVSGNNLTSLANALARLGYPFVMTHDAAEIQEASHVILPGVGTATFGMNALREYGLVKVLTSLTQPLLGICLGMHLLLEYSDEGQVDCLGLIPGRVQLLKNYERIPVPHMGWNQLHWCQDSPLKQGLSSADCVYFVHSYALRENNHALAHCEYGEPFAAIIKKGSVFGMQFHPEKSATIGMILLENFLEMRSVC